MRKTLLFVAALSLALFSAPVRANDEGGEAKEVTVTGEVLDLTCFLEHGAKGADHATCAKSCLVGGLPAGFLEDKTGNVYLVITKDHKSANAALADKAGKTVKITGVIKKSQGVNVLVMAKVE